MFLSVSILDLFQKGVVFEYVNNIDYNFMGGHINIKKKKKKKY